MVVKVYISGISGNKEVKKRQQRVCMILDSKNITYECIDITEPGKEAEKEFMQQNSNAKDTKHPLPPQLFNDETYCGDYDEFDLANENDELEKFLKVPVSASNATKIENGHVANGTTSSRENSADKESGDQQVPESPEQKERRSEEESIEMAVDNTEEPVKEAVEEESKPEEDKVSKEEDEEEEEEEE